MATFPFTTGLFHTKCASSFSERLLPSTQDERSSAWAGSLPTVTSAGTGWAQRMKTLPVEKQEEHTDQPAEDVRRPEEQLPSFRSAMTKTELLTYTAQTKRSSFRMKQSDLPA